MKRILIIGAGRDQVPIIKCAKSLGHFVIVASRAGSYPGFELADRCLRIDIRDYATLIQAAKASAIDGVISDQLDAAVLTVARIARELGLTGPSEKAALLFTNKRIMRQRSRELGIPVPQFEVVTDVESAVRAAASIGYPVVLKPTDSSGSRGVQLIRSDEDVRRCFGASASFSSGGDVLVEEFIKGRQILARGFVDEGRLSLYAYADRGYFGQPHQFVTNSTIFPSNIGSELTQAIVSYHERLVKDAEVDFGATGSEWIIENGSNKPVLVEAALRGGGAFISSDLIPAAYGLDYQSHLIQRSLREPVATFDMAALQRRASAYLCFLLPAGRVQHVSGLEKVRNICGVTKVFLDELRVGLKVEPASFKGSRFGPILIARKSREEVDAVIREIRQTLQVTVSTSSGLAGITWH